ncbi:MAG TPA: DUF4097 family beta strand repeat-containing protein [Pyrinomonadaceae bacterium]|nr:DUF4097 family beta strand repeat-containing protein [Pyrinomonadaceae bacterium]
MIFTRAIITAQQVTAAPEGSNPQQSGPTVGRDQEGRVTLKLERGGRVALDNRTTGRITVTGWDRDTIEATATSAWGVEAVEVRVKDDSSGARISLNTRHAHREFRLGEEATIVPLPKLEVRPSNPPPPAASAPAGTLVNSEPESSPQQAAIAPSDSSRQEQKIPQIFRSISQEIHLEVKVPRYAEIEPIKVIRSKVEITGVDTPLIINGDRSTIRLSRVGAVEVRTRSGNVEVENASGLVDVMTTSGAITVRYAGNDVRALSINGPVNIQCARGRVNISNTDGSIALEGIGGDVDATTTNSAIRLTVAIRDDGRYHLKSMSGPVEMIVRESAPGFTAVLSSYRGEIETDFSLKTKQKSPPADTQSNRRIISRYGDGQAQVTLDSFDGAVRLSRAAPGAMKDCR